MHYSHKSLSKQKIFLTFVCLIELPVRQVERTQYRFTISGRNFCIKKLIVAFWSTIYMLKSLT